MSRSQPRPRTGPALAVVAALAVLLVGCAAGGDVGSVPSGPPSTEEAAAGASPSSDASPSADAGSTAAESDRPDAAEPSLPTTGTLGLAEVEGGCVYVDIDGQRFELMAATGSDLAVDPSNGVVADATGTVIARAGDTVTVDGTIDPGIVTFCQIGPVLVASEITTG